MTVGSLWVVPVEFLSDDQAAAFGRFVGEPSQNDLERFFHLDDADQELIRRRRGEHSRIGFAVQVGTARFLGALLADPLDVPWTVVDYVAAQLGIADPSVVKRYTERVETAKGSEEDSYGNSRLGRTGIVFGCGC